MAGAIFVWFLRQYRESSEDNALLAGLCRWSCGQSTALLPCACVSVQADVCVLPWCAGVYLSKDLMTIAGHSLKANITTLAPLVLPISEQLLFFINLVMRKVCTQRALPLCRARHSSRRPARA